MSLAITHKLLALVILFAGDGIVIFDGKIASIQREKDTVKEVKKGFECGITLENYSDIKEGDILENYEMVEVKR